MLELIELAGPPDLPTVSWHSLICLYNPLLRLLLLRITDVRW